MTNPVDWKNRISQPGVVWHHGFERPEEVDNFLRESHAFFKILPDGRKTANRSTTFGVHDKIHFAHQVQDRNTASGFAVEIKVLGSRLAADITADQDYIDLVDASEFPDPAGDPNRYYWLSIHADANHLFYIPPGETVIRKGYKEVVGVTRKEGNRLFVVRSIPYAESASTGGTRAKAFLAGCPVGVDTAGGWERPLSALDGTTNGRGEDDPAASGTLKVRSHAPRDGFKSFGYYSHPWYVQHPEFNKLLQERDGEDFWIQWRLFIDPRRSDPDHPGGKLWFVIGAQGGGLQQIVGSGPSGTRNRLRLYSDLGTEDYGVPNTGMQWPLGEWFTCLMHVRPGLSKDAKVPHPASNGGDDTPNSLAVLTDRFAPTNTVDDDGVRRLRFETSLPPLFRYYPESFNRHSPGYFNKNWAAAFPRNGSFRTDNWVPGGATLRVDSTEIVDGRMRWTLAAPPGSRKPMTTGVPFAGAQLQVRPHSVRSALPAAYRTQELDFWIKRDGQPPEQAYGVKNYAIPYGSGWNKFGNPARMPPAYSHFMPTGYSNVWDNLAPAPACTFIRFGDVICSQTEIPWPADPT